MRIGIVNDLPEALDVLQQMVAAMSGQEVAWLARSGAEAISKCTRDRPDLVLMDLLMADIDGVEATRRIMRQCPCAILAITASIRDNQALAFEVLAAGALDVAGTPATVADVDGETGHSLHKKIANISRIIGKAPPPARHPAQAGSKLTRGNSADEDDLIIAIGASTGGPTAVVDVLKSLPVGFPAAVVVVLHVDEKFAAGMAEWMDGLINMPVRMADEGEHPEAGTVLLAATNEHLVLTCNQTLHYTPEPVDCPYRPSVDAFFFSLVQHWRRNMVGVLLTGMGRDGAKGLKAMHELGWHTIAQDEKSSAIYGMPGAAAKIGAVSKILPLESIGSMLIRAADQYEKKSRAASARTHGGSHAKQ